MGIQIHAQRLYNFHSNSFFSHPFISFQFISLLSFHPILSPASIIFSSSIPFKIVYFSHLSSFCINKVIGNLIQHFKNKLFGQFLIDLFVTVHLIHLFANRPRLTRWQLPGDIFNPVTIRRIRFSIRKFGKRIFAM